MRLLVGQLAYLNTRPFDPLLGGRHRVFRAAPAEIGRLARAGELDAGLVSTGDLLACEDRYQPVGDPDGAFGIACRRQAGSVFLLSRVDPGKLGGAVVEVTPETSTSILLLRLYLERWLGVAPMEYRRGVTGGADAALLIGDAALRERAARDRSFRFRVDLAAEWRVWTGLPFVFAVWVIRRSLTDGTRAAFGALLSESLALGLADIPGIASRNAGPLGDADALSEYLSDFTYRFEAGEREGLARFIRMADEHGLSPRPNRSPEKTPEKSPVEPPMAPDGPGRSGVGARTTD